MHGRILKRAVVALALLLVASVAAGQSVHKLRNVIQVPDAPDTFSASGEFVGTLDWEFPLGGAMYHLSPDAQIYEIGRGLLPIGSLIGDRFIYISGVGPAGSSPVTTVIVRPSDEAAASNVIPDGSVQMRDPSAPR